MPFRFLRPSSTTPDGPLDCLSDDPYAARVEVSAWLAADDASLPQPTPSATAMLHLGAEGICLRTTTRRWYVPFPELEAHTLGEDHVLLRLEGGRHLEVRTPAPHVLVKRLETRLTDYARHGLLSGHQGQEPSPTAATSTLLSVFENPTTPRDQRLEVASWLGTRPLEPGDVLYLRRIMRDVADPELSALVSQALDLDTQPTSLRA